MKERSEMNLVFRWLVLNMHPVGGCHFANPTR